MLIKNVIEQLNPISCLLTLVGSGYNIEKTQLCVREKYYEFMYKLLVIIYYA